MGEKAIGDAALLPLRGGGEHLWRNRLEGGGER